MGVNLYTFVGGARAHITLKWAPTMVLWAPTNIIKAPTTALAPTIVKTVVGAKAVSKLIIVK